MVYNNNVENIVRNLKKILSSTKCVYKGRYYLIDGKQVSEELLMWLSKFTSMILFIKRDKILLEKFNDGYKKFVWILNRINPKDYTLKVKNYKALKDNIESLIILIKSMNAYFKEAERSPLAYHPYSDSLLKSMVKDMMGDLESHGIK